MPENSEQLVWAIARSSAFLTVGFVIVWTTLKVLKIQSPRVHRVCWSVVLAQGLVFVTMHVEVPLLPATAPSTDVRHREAMELSSIPFESSGKTIVGNGISSDQFDNSTNARTHNGHIPASQMLVVCWLIGIVVTLVTQAVGYFRFVSGIRKKVDTSAAWKDQWSDVCATAGVRRTIEFTITEQHGPALCWTSNGYQLLIPEGHWKNLSAAQRELVLRHELAHYQRCDLWTGLLFHSLASLHWFNPFAWLSVRRLAECAEWCCDAEVRGAATTNCTEYVEALLEFSLPRQRVPTVIPTATGHSVVRRAQRLLTPNFKEDSGMKKLTITLVVAALAIVNGMTFDLVAQESTIAADASTSTETTQNTNSEETAESAEKSEGKTSHDAAQLKDSADLATDGVFILADDLNSGIRLQSNGIRMLTDDGGALVTVPGNLQLTREFVRPAAAESPFATREAVIDISYVFQNLPEFERVKKRLQQGLQLDDQRMRIEQKRLQLLAEKLKHVTNVDEREELETELAGRRASMNAEIATARRRLKGDEAKTYAAVYTRVRKAIADHAKEHGIQIVRRATTGREQQKKLESGDPQAVLQAMNAQVLYIADESIDITDAVLERLNNKSSDSVGSR